jgi:hypothetical protein
MRMSRQEFRQWPRKAVTLLGMSGVGKTHLANRLPKNNWFHYSGDYRIGTKYLEEPILDNIKRQAMQVDFLRDLLRNDSIYIASNISVHNLEPVSSFLGKLGNPALGGLRLDEFKRRQRLHALAEAAAMKDVAEFIDKAHTIYGYDHFLNDAGGSIVELDDPEVMQTLAEHTLILYLQAGPEMEEKLVRRAVSHPKPLYYRDDFLDAQLTVYPREQGLGRAEEIDPDHFMSWIFPLLARDRRPRYEAAAEQYGYTVPAESVEAVRTESDFIDLVAEAIPEGA